MPLGGGRKGSGTWRQVEKPVLLVDSRNGDG
jgi:hypothetical protein